MPCDAAKGQSSDSVALILAGGRGIRMRRLGEYLPKCVLTIYDQPLLIRHLEDCRKAGIGKVYISYGAQFEGIIKSIVGQYEKALSSYSCPRPEITLLLDRELKGPVNGLLLAEPYIRGKATLLFLGDIYLEQHDFVESFANGKSEEIVLDTYREPQIDKICSGCSVVVENNMVQKILEKPSREDISGDLCWTGLSYLPPHFFGLVDRLNQSFTRQSSHIGEVYEKLRRQKSPISFFEETGAVINLTTPDDLLRANLFELRKLSALMPSRFQIFSEVLEILKTR